MKKASVILLLIALISASYWFFYAQRAPKAITVKKTIIFLTNGDEIDADEIKGEGGFLFYYVVDGQTRSVEKSLVRDTETITLKEAPEKKPSIADDLKRLAGNSGIGGLIPEDTRARLSIFLLNYSPYIYTVLIAGPIFGGLYYIFRKHKKFRGKRKKRDENTKDYRPAVTAGSDFISEESERLVRHFLRLYKLQIGADLHAPEAIRLVRKGTNTSGKRIYELRVYVQNDWKTRRMSIVPLGESSGSKSTCFYVIFDVHLVVKIPPESIAGFDAYYQCIQADREIARKLAPRECIVPYVSVVMSRVKPLEEASYRTPDRVEEKYVKELRNNPDLQEYLKIGGRFVFFMDLSRFFFLGNIVEDMHDIRTRISQEISGNPAIIWNEEEFENRYGAIHAHVVKEMRSIYNDFHSGVKALEDDEKEIRFEDFQIRKWFPILISGNHLTKAEKGLSGDVAERINMIFSDLAAEKKDTLKEHRQAITAYVKQIAFRQHKPQMESIGSNLLELLAWMGDKGVAMRDLKPDNLMVTGDRNRYPAFLVSADEYKIGLIDVETAVDLRPPPGRGFTQPPLGGTPYYATPSHLFTNELIGQVFGDLPGILHLQDWHATIGIIFNVIIGSYLFEKTGKRMPSLAKIMEEAFAVNDGLAAAAEKMSRLFWESASEEFHARMENNRDILKSIHISIPENFRLIFINVLNEQQENIISKIKTVIANQSFVESDKMRNTLIRSSSGQINREKAKWMELNPTITPEKQKKIVRFLDTIAELKYTAEKLALGVNIVHRPASVLATDELLEYMYCVVHTAMYLAPYGFQSPPNEV